MAAEMTSMERIQTALRRGTADRVPVLLTSTTHGAKLLGLSLPEYFARAEHVAEGQLRFVQAFGHDNLSAHFYAGQEAEAFGGEMLYHGDGPPNVAKLPISDLSAIDTLEVPDIAASAPLLEALRCIRILAERSAGRWPVLGMIVGPASLPIMLVGLEAWLELLLYGSARRRKRLLRVAVEFCIGWANAQLAAGANAIALAEPMASAAMLTREQAARHALPWVRQVVARIKGPVVFAGVGGIHSVADLIPDVGAVAASTDPTDDLREIKAAIGGRLAVLGGLNDQAMLTWTPDEAVEATRRAISEGAPGGGFILGHQNEIPMLVSDEVLEAIVTAARRWGSYGVSS